MNNTLTHIEFLLKSNTSQEMLDYALKMSNEINIKDIGRVNSIYSPDLAIKELGVDLELLDQLIEDYVGQIIKACLVFKEFVAELQDLKTYTSNLDYTILRELAHKNLGVARNLRLDDSQKLLHKIMIGDDLDYISICVESLFACAVVLKPEHAYKTIRLIRVKDSF